MSFSAFFSVFSFQLLAAGAVSMFIFGGSLRKLTRAFNEECRKKEDPDFPLTFDEVHDALQGQPNLAPFVIFQRTRKWLRLVWKHHDDKEVERLAKRIRTQISVVTVLWGMEFTIFCGIAVWKALFS
jgi:hypothetical protein